MHLSCIQRAWSLVECTNSFQSSLQQFAEELVFIASCHSFYFLKAGNLFSCIAELHLCIHHLPIILIKKMILGRSEQAFCPCLGYSDCGVAP